MAISMRSRVPTESYSCQSTSSNGLPRLQCRRCQSGLHAFPQYAQCTENRQGVACCFNIVHTDKLNRIQTHGKTERTQRASHSTLHRPLFEHPADKAFA